MRERGALLVTLPRHGVALLCVLAVLVFYYRFDTDTDTLDRNEGLGLPHESIRLR